MDKAIKMMVRPVSRTEEGIFSIEDINAILIENNIENQIMYLENIFVDKGERNKGIGSRACDKLKIYGDDVIIMTDSKFLLDEYPEEVIINDELADHTLLDLNRFFVKNNFVNVNSILSQYETKETFIYNNKIGKKVIGILLDREEKFNSEMKRTNTSQGYKDARAAINYQE